MPQSILIQVGQCGNQVGFNFWKKLIEEYELNRELMDDYFLKPKKKSSDDIVNSFNPRCVLVDMEEKVINECCQGKFNNFFDNHQKILDVSGSGNNWCRGYREYGLKYMNTVVNVVRKEVEHCDNLDAFYFIFSIGGGTGSGLGSAILEQISTEFTRKLKINFSIFPSANDDVVISPYNALLANSKLGEFSSMIIPYENDVISDRVKELGKPVKFFRTNKKLLSANSSVKSRRESAVPFSGINDIISSTMSDLTGVLHFPGELPANSQSLVTNLIPSGRLNYTMPSSSPFILAPEYCSFYQVINDLFSRNHFLIESNGWPQNRVLSSTVACRGKGSSNDFQNNISRVREKISLNMEGVRNINLVASAVPPPNRGISTLLLANSTNVRSILRKMSRKFFKMYRKKVYLHHYKEVDSDAENIMNLAATNLNDVIEQYELVDRNSVNALSRHIVL